MTILLAAREEAGPGVEGARAAIRELDRVRPQRGADPIREYGAAPRALVSGNLRRQVNRVLDDMIGLAKKEIEMLQPHLMARP